MIDLAVPQALAKSAEMMSHSDQISAKDHEDLVALIKALSARLNGVGKVVRNYKGAERDGLELAVVEEFPAPPEPVAVEEKAENAETNVVSASAEPVLSVMEQQKIIEEAEKSQDDQLRSLTSAIKEMVLVHEEAPKLLSETEAKQDPIKVSKTD